MDYVMRTTLATTNDDNYQGDNTNEVFMGLKGDDYVDGSDGIDFMYYNANSTQFYFTQNNTNIDVFDTQFRSEGHDYLVNVERLYFNDTAIAFDFNANAKIAAQFIGTIAVDQLHNKDIFGQVINLVDNGYTMSDLFNYSINNGIINNLAGGNSNSDLVSLVYKNITGTDISSTDLDSYLSLFTENGGTMNQVDFLQTASALDLNNQHIDLIGLSQSGLAYTHII